MFKKNCHVPRVGLFCFLVLLTSLFITRVIKAECPFVSAPNGEGTPDFVLEHCSVGQFWAHTGTKTFCRSNHELIEERGFFESATCDNWDPTLQEWQLAGTQSASWHETYGQESPYFYSYYCNQKTGDYRFIIEEHYGCFDPIPYEPSGCNPQCSGNFVFDENQWCGCTCGLSEVGAGDCRYIDYINCEYVDYQFNIDEMVLIDCEERDLDGRPLVKLILQERKWKPGWSDSVLRAGNDISVCMENIVKYKPIEVWEYGDCGVGVPKPDIYRGTFIYPDQMELYIGKGRCNYYLKVDWDDPDLWWFNTTSFPVECPGDCIFYGPSEDLPPPIM